jgi:hypothetical protein
MTEISGVGEGMTPKEPLNKSRTVATAAFRDELREARRSEWLDPLRKPSDKADRPESPVPYGLRQNAAPASSRSLAS